ncbi:hypothetical protein FB451DRAFT_1239641 [Mycena latifolia]|nr:hypothetical protein FB451DRAFT_1239641 [Mycena latifolia]
MSLGSSTSAPRTDPPKDWVHARIRLEELTVFIDTLTAERQHLQAELDSIVYPVLTLPVEITSHIFLHSIPKNKEPSSYTAPLLLTQICRQWRAIALAAPNLWQSLTVGRRQQHIHCGKLLRMWLERSASLPLFLCFGSPGGAQTQSLIDASLIHRHRWEEIEISSCANLVASQETFPILRKVTLLSSDLTAPRTITILDAPILREALITLNPSEDAFHGFDVQLPWGQLTSLTLETLHFVECLPILSQCFELGTLKYSSIFPMHDEESTDTFRQSHVMLPSLHTLTVEHHSPLTYLTLPGLRQLTWSGTIAPAVEPFRALLSRSHCPLRQLTIVRAFRRTRPEELRRFYQSFPTVTSLTLAAIGFAELHQNVDSLSSSDILPLMQNLTIDAVRGRDNYDSLFDVLCTRRSPSSGAEILKTFTLTLRPHNDDQAPAASSPLPQPVMAQFLDLAMQGLEIRIGLQTEFGKTPVKIILDTFASKLPTPTVAFT